MSDTWTMAMKEWRELLFQQGSLRGNVLSMLIFLGIFGVFLPLQAGPEWVSSPSLMAYWAWLPMFLASGLIADAFAGERERHTLETLLASRLSNRSILFGKVLAAIVYSWGFMVVGMLIGLVVVNLAHAHGQLLMYDPLAAGVILGIGLLAAWLVAGVGVLISLRASTVRQAQQLLMVAILVVVFVPILAIQWVPQSIQAQLIEALSGLDVLAVVVLAVVALLVVNGLLMVAALARFQRAKLILD